MTETTECFKRGAGAPMSATPRSLERSQEDVSPLKVAKKKTTRHSIERDYYESLRNNLSSMYLNGHNSAVLR